MQLQELINREELDALRRPSNGRALWVCTVNVALLALGFALPIAWPHPMGWMLGAIVLGGRALGLGILVHDTAHLTMFSSRGLNEWAGTWLFGSLPNIDYQSYRRGHLAHHRHAGTAADPDLQFVHSYPASAASMMRKLVRDISGLNGLKGIAVQLKNFRLRAQLPFLLAHALLLSALFVVGAPEVYACWWLGQLFVFPLLMRLRAMGEHGGVPDPNDPDPRRHTGTTLAGPLARLLCAPNRVNYHVEHHLAAAVPSYRLPDLHRLLAARGYFDDVPCVMPSYFAVIRRCLACDGRAPAKGRRRS